jgi:hypothetical protein
MKTQKPDMTIRDAVKNLIGFVLIIMIVPPFFGAIIRTNTPSRESREIDAAADRIGASLDKNNPQKAVSTPPVAAAPPVAVAPPVAATPPVAMPAEILEQKEALEQEAALDKEFEAEQSVIRGVADIHRQHQDGTIQLTLKEIEMYREILRNSREKLDSIGERYSRLPVSRQEEMRGEIQ